MGITVAWGIAASLAVVFQCIPISMAWDTTSIRSQCFNLKAYVIGVRDKRKCDKRFTRRCDTGHTIVFGLAVENVGIEESFDQRDFCPRCLVWCRDSTLSIGAVG